MRIIIFLIITAVLLVLLVLGVRAIYVSFAKKKDERSKWIVQASMAQAFIVMSILQLIVYVAKYVNLAWWENLKKGIYVDPFAVSFMVLGLLLIINTKKHGGSL